MIDALMLHGMISGYIHKDGTPPVDLTTSIPFPEIKFILTNYTSIDLEKTIEVFLKILFGKTKVSPDFSFTSEIGKIGFCKKYSNFKKLYIKRLFYSISYMKSQLKDIKKEDSTPKNPKKVNF